MEENRTSATVVLLTLTLTLLHFPATTTSTTSPLFSAATQALTDSGFLSMSLTLRLASPSLPATATSATIFAPSGASFRRWGPLPLSLLQYHILPCKLPLQHLTTLPFSTPLPTLLPNCPLTVTTSAQSHSNQLSLNNLTVSTAPLFNNPSLLILPLNDFFNSSSLFLPEPLPSEPLIRVLNSNDRSLTAAFLQARLFSDYAVGTKLTVFAPPDEAVRNVTVSASDDYYYSAILRKHVVPKLITWRDLIRLPGGTLLPTLSDGFVIRVGVSPRLRLLNGVAVTVPDMYRGASIVVHGVDGLLDKEENR